MGRYRPSRAGNGRFRQTTLADFGMGHCDRCGAIFTPDLSHLQGAFIDPRDMAKAMKACPHCDGAKTVGDVFVQDRK